jgi:hypothetical protein
MKCRWLPFLAFMAMASAQTTLPLVLPSPSFSFGMAGLAAGQSVRLNVLNLVRTPPPVAIAQFPCKVEIDLYDSTGKMVKQKVVANLGYGQADFLDLDRTELAGSQRIEISGGVVVGSNQSFFCSIAPNLEVYDTSTGKTTAVLAPVSSGVGAFIRTVFP